EEIRLFLHGGDDRLIVRGAGGSGPLLRVIGGEGDDELTDSSRAGGTQFYDDQGKNRFVTGPGTSVDRRHYDEPPRDTSTFSLPRDWGSRWMPLTWVSYSPDLGVFVGVGADGTGYDFRRLPYNSHVRVRAGYATAAATYRAEFTGEFRGIVPPVIARLRLRASGIDVLRFYGLGNETPNSGSQDFYKVKPQQYLVAPALEFTLSSAAKLSVSPVFKFAHTKLEPNTFIDATRPAFRCGRRSPSASPGGKSGGPIRPMKVPISAGTRRCAASSRIASLATPRSSGTSSCGCPSPGSSSWSRASWGYLASGTPDG